MHQKIVRLVSILASITILAVPALASAHVVVTPKQVGVGESATFTVSVPNERTNAMTELKLMLPGGVSGTMPTHKPGWDITLTHQAGNESEVTAITWKGGTLPEQERDEFTFKTKVPAKTGNLKWKAYQTYADGTVVSWDQTPSNHDTDEDDSTKGPFSVTKVVDDLSAEEIAKTDNTKTIAIIALALAAASLAFSLRPRSKKRS